MNREAVLENVRRYRAIASLYQANRSLQARSELVFVGNRLRIGSFAHWRNWNSTFESIAGTMQHFSDMQLRADDVRSLG